MSIVMQNNTLNSSSSQCDGVEDMAITNVKNYVKDLLKSRIFLGRYLERRLIDERIGYRDVVLVSAAELELKRDLLEAEHKLRVIYPRIHWIGITNNDSASPLPPGICLWTEIDNQPFGPFWFQIKSLKFRQDEIIVTVKCIRYITDAFLELEPILTEGTGRVKTNHKREPNNTEGTSLGESTDEIIATLKSAVSIRNVKEFFTFVFALVIAVFTGSTSLINFLGNFVLALIREVSIFIKNSTPMFLGFLDFLSKIVGGFYILLAMFFKPSNNPGAPKRTLTYYEPQYQNQYDHRQFD